MPNQQKLKNVFNNTNSHCKVQQKKLIVYFKLINCMKNLNHRYPGYSMIQAQESLMREKKYTITS